MQRQTVPDPSFNLMDATVSEVFLLMLALPCAPARACCLPCPGLSATVAFSGALNGFCMLHLDLACAAVLTTQLTGETPSTDSPMLADIAGELCNIIAGAWKSRLAEPLAACHLSPPIVTVALAPQTFTRAYRFNEYCLKLDLAFA